VLSDKAKSDEVLSTSSQAEVTSCQQCVRTLTSYVKRNKIKLEVLDTVQLVRNALIPASSARTL
jgi:heterodisulfide reductase subunit D